MHRTLGVVAFAALASCAHPNRLVRMDNGLQYRVLKTGSGPTAQSGETVRIHERTTLPHGTVIYDSYVKGTPVLFKLGAKQVIDGVDLGVTGMRVGEHRMLIVPPTLSRRASYPDNTPRDSTLHIAVELVEIRR